MKFSKNWLLEWVKPQATVQQLSEKFTSLGFEIESITPLSVTFTNVVVAEILEAVRHPDAEKLQVCKVSDGKEIYQIVCGAKNARAGIKVALAKIGAQLPNSLKISKAKLRGIESFGMLCSVSELGMADTSEGILELPSNASLGMDIYEFFSLNDDIIDVAITPNRGDCLSIRGLAREIAAGYGLTLPDKSRSVFAPQANKTVNDSVTVIVKQPKLCPRYCTCIIKNINPEAKTPIWMQEKLRRSGMSSIHPVVDVTNYVMLELGQPMHAFDYAKIIGGIEIRLATAGEKLELLDTNTVTLRSDTLVIADSQKPLAIAGIMGGKPSAVTAQTTNVVLESAFFSPDYCMGHPRHYNITTDSSQRFERGVDPEITLIALHRAIQLILEICGGQANEIMAGEITEVVATDQLPHPKIINLRRARIERILGVTIPDHEVVRILEGLGMKVSTSSQAWEVTTPSWRFDLNIEVDLIEELARVYGFDQIPVVPPCEQLVIKTDPEDQRTIYSIKQRLAACGYYETLTYSFIDPKWHELLFPNQDSIKLLNPLSAELSVMRASLWPSLLNALLVNNSYQQERVRLFEVGRVFLGSQKDLAQPLRLGAIVSGSALPEQWGVPTRAADFFDVKGDLELLLKPCGSIRFEPIDNLILHPGQSAQILLDEVVIGLIGVLHPSISQQLKLTNNVLLFEVDLDKISHIEIPQFQRVSKFPAIRRDLAIVVSEEIAFKQLYDIVENSAGSLLADLSVFDIYRGSGVGAGKKSVALRLTLQKTDRTLVEDEVNQVIEQVTANLKTNLQAQLRN